MLKQILLLTPVYVTLFWVIVLFIDRRRFNTPRAFLGWFMFCAFCIYLSHFLFFESYRDLYVWIDPFYQFASLLAYPLYHIYFRMLTVDSKFTLKKHGWYLLTPSILFVLYSIGVCSITFTKYQAWIFDRSLGYTSSGMHFLKVIYPLMRGVFLVQVIYCLIGNALLIRKHAEKAAQFYSDMEDSKTNIVFMLNFSLIICSVTSFIIASLGRDYFKDQIWGLAIASFIFSSMLFIIGLLGYKQRSLNPSCEELTFIPLSVEEAEEEYSDFAQRKLLEKLIHLIEERRAFMDCKLNIQTVAQEIGTNRTYVSSIINKHFNQNFCSYINTYRVEELKKVIRAHPEFTNQLLAESAGFGSIDSLKRAVQAITQKNLSEWKKHILTEKVDV